MSENANTLNQIHELLLQLNSRMDRLEGVAANPQSAIQNPKSVHVTQERFRSLEEVADAIIGELGGAEKPCPYEPTAKPCDNCAMCSSRGF